MLISMRATIKKDGAETKRRKNKRNNKKQADTTEETWNEGMRDIYIYTHIYRERETRDGKAIESMSAQRGAPEGRGKSRSTDNKR